MQSHEFDLRREYATDLLKRAWWGKIAPEEFVLMLSPDQRAAWLTAMIDAEGSKVPGYQPWHKDHVRIAQNEGPLLEAIKLAVFLEGFQPSVVPHNPPLASAGWWGCGHRMRRFPTGLLRKCSNGSLSGA